MFSHYNAELMKVLLAGYNLDTEVIKELSKNSDRQDITPETLSASYARISRDPRPVDELRADARGEVERARRSNKSIIFGMGHHSVAEHAVFNFDLIGISRLAIEEIEKFRLCSYTEKSQRYIKLERDFVLPQEIKGSEFEKEFIDTIQLQNDFYHRAYDELHELVFKKHADLAKDKKNHRMLEGWAKEDARYIASLATEGQLGMTINARNLEYLFRRFASAELEEVRNLGSKMFSLVEKIAPSIILFTKANDYDEKTYGELRELCSKILRKGKKSSKEEVELVDYTPDADTKVIAAIIHTSSDISFNDCLKKAEKMKEKERKQIILAACQHMELYDAALREFEFVDLTFDLTPCAACFGQLKRHRLASITSQRYDPALGITIPESIKEVKMDKKFKDIALKTSEVYLKMKDKVGGAAQYVLANAHRKRVLMRVNARELYHISRLREDSAAQWDIRRLSGEMSKLAKKVMPLTMLLIGGKDNYPKIYEKIYGKPPKVISPTLPGY